MRLPIAMATAGISVLISAMALAAFYAFHGCWDTLTRLVRGREIASHPLASPDEPKADATSAGAPRRSVVFSLTQTRFRSGGAVTRAGRFRFDGFVAPGRRSPPSQMFVDLTVGERFSRVDFRACWWVPADVAVAESVAEERMSWEGGPAAHNKGKSI